jgi:hypothetical protein
MAKMGSYVKAYPTEDFRKFHGWSEAVQNSQPEPTPGNGEQEEGEDQSTGDFFYLQENFTVTDGIFLDENIVFNDVTPEWIDFCKNTLKFEVPVYSSAAIKEKVEVAAATTK